MEKSMKKTILITLIIIGVGLMGIFSYYNYNNYNVFKNNMDNVYDSNFSGMIENFTEINSTLGKINISNDESAIRKDLVRIYGLSLLTIENINALPFSHTSTLEVTEFLNKSSDYYMYLTNKLGDEDIITSTDKEYIKEIYEASNSLLGNLVDLNDKISYGYNGRDWSSEGDFYVKNTVNNLDEGFENTTKEVNGFPKLIYDGPFSDEVRDDNQLALLGDSVTKEEAEEKLKEEYEDISFIYESKGDIPCYVFSAKKDGFTYYIKISVKGGKLIIVAGDYNAFEMEKTLTIEEANKIGQDFLGDRGIENMSANYYETYDNVTTFNYVYEKEDIAIYPDIIKVKVSLADGSIVGYEASNYYMSHYDREIDTRDLMDLETLESKLSKEFKITNTRLAIVPTASKEEVLCYEFKGTYNEDIYIIYLDAKSGEQVEIFKVIEADTSVLTL